MKKREGVMQQGHTVKSVRDNVSPCQATLTRNDLRNDLKYADIVLRGWRREVGCKSNDIILKPMSYRILEFLVRNSETLVSRKEIFQHIWGYDFDPGTKVLDVQICYLRKILVDLECSVSIVTLRRKGLLLSGDCSC